MYSLITSAMTWSYSRITAFEQCPYKFFITYIMPCESVPMFYSDYGSFMHELLAYFYSGKKTKEEVISLYVTRFRTKVLGKAPSQKIFIDYFSQGLTHLKQLTHPSEAVLGVEEFVEFGVDGFPFVGYVDLITARDDDMSIVDHKSHALKSRSVGNKHTKSDKELDDYLRQLYLYSIPIEQKYGKYPNYLKFNCYRKNSIIENRFDASALISVKDWAISSINNIIQTESFYPNLDWYFCKYICGVHNDCEYYTTQF